MSNSAVISEHGALPLAPQDHPRNLLIRFVLNATRKRFGRTPMAFRVVYTRFSWAALASVVLGLILEFALRIGGDLSKLIQVSHSLRVGCTFCSDLVLAEATRKRVGLERFAQLLDFETSALFTPREKAALAYASAVAESLHVSDATWERLAQHFSERERIEIVWVCAVERYFNGMALPLRIGSDDLAKRAAA